MAARSIWKGSISFGLVNIPIQVFSATDILEALKASLKVKSKPTPPSAAAKSKRKMDMAVSR